jgi:hypothetical protein
MRKKLFFVAILMLLALAANAIYVEVGTGSETTNYIPAYGYYDYGWSRTIYLQTDLINEMEINTISYHVGNSPSNYNMLNQSFYIKHTTDSSILSTEYVDPTTDDSYELVFNGDLTYNGGGWFDITLDSSFEYNGTDNLEILVLNNDGSYTTGYPNFLATTATPQQAVYKYADGTFPTTAGTLSSVFPNTRFHFTAENEPGMATLTAPENGSINLTLPVELAWTNGEDTDWVKVYFSSEFSEVSEMNANALVADEYTQETYTLDNLESLTNYYWKIVSGNNISEYLASTPIWSFSTAAEEGSIVIGNGTETNQHLPMEPFYGYTISQSIYDQEWLNIDNQRIEQVSYYYNGNSAWTEDNVQLYLGHTDLDTFTDGDSWLPLDTFVLCYDGPLTVPAEEGWVTIPLSVPFNYNNEDNLVIGFESNTQGYSSSNDEFLCTATNGTKSIYYYSDGTNSDFITPQSGTAHPYIPNILLTVGDIPTTPQLMVTPEEYSWDDTIINSSANTVTFTMRNTGLGTLTVNSLSIDQTTDFIMVDDNSYPLNLTDDTAQFTVTFHPLTVGDFTANLTINDAENGDTIIPLSGSGYDAMIYDFPHLEGFEGLEANTLPQDWNSILNSTSSYASVGVITSNPNTGDNSFRFYNSGDLEADLIAFTPPVSGLTTKRIRVYAKSSDENTQLKVGVCDSNSNIDNFELVETLTLTTEYQEFFVNLNVENDNNQFIVFKADAFLNTYDYVYIDDLSIEEMPTGPVALITPLEWTYPATILNTSSLAEITIRNIGLGTLTINSVVLDQTTDFILVDDNEYPLNITNAPVVIGVNFHPLTEGDFTANLTITDDQGSETIIPLAGNGYDAMISDFPHFEGFEGYDTGALPLDWSTVVNSTTDYANAAVNTSAFEGERSFRFYNSSDTEAQITAITPPINNLTARRIRFMAKSSTAGAGIIIGTASNNSGDINFTARDTVYLTTEYQQFQHGFSTAPEDDQFIALEYLGLGTTYLSVYIDNFFIESIPTGPAIVVTQDTLNFGDVYLNRTGVAQLNIQNWGIAPLEIDFSQDGDELIFIPNELTIAPNETQIVEVNLTPIAEGAYSGSFNILSNDTAIPSIEIATSAFILPALPDNIAIIGNGELTGQSIPFEPWYRHTWSQSIYYSGEIGIADQRIEKISWHYNGNSAWGPDDMKIYMGLTSEVDFADGDSWISFESLMEVYNGSITVPQEDGWVEFELDIPFIYDNSQNLVVGVFHTVPQYHASGDEFYCTASDLTRSLVYYSDSTVPDPAAPPTANYQRNSYANVQLEFGAIPDAPDLTVYPTNSLFEMTPVDGNSVEKTITMRSIGLQDVTIANAPTLGGDDADQFTITTDNNTYPLVLPFNDIATIGVAFTPNSEGTKSATIQIVDDATRVTHEVVISGYAYADDNNDVPEDAVTLTLPVDGDTYAIMPIGDIDWYKIPAMGISDTLLCSVEDAGGSDVNPSMWLYGPANDASEIDPAVYLDNGSNIEFVLPQSGNYFLRVAKSNVNPQGATPPHTRKNENGENERLTREDTGLYNLYVDANYNYDFNSPLNLEASNQSGYVALTWVEPPYERYLTGYHIYRDGEVITEEMIPIGTNLYHDANVVVGTEYHYHVVGMYEDPEGFSLPSNTAIIIYYNIGEPLWGDDFDDHEDFTLNLPGWIQYDIDGGNTYTISNVDYDNAGSAMSYMVFNPSATTPPIEDMIPQSGDKFLTSFASTEGQNDDWIITPRFTVGTTSVVSFYAKSYTDEFGLERFRVKMSLGGSEVSDFQYSLHQGIDYLEAPTEWTLYNFNVSELTGTTVRFAIECISNDAFIFMVDNFRIDSTPDGVDNEHVEDIPQINSLAQNYPNPFNPETSIAFTTKEAGNVSIDIYNVKGQKVKTLLNDYRSAGNHSVVWNGRDDNNKAVASGLYFYKMRNGKFSSTKKMILMK